MEKFDDAALYLVGYYFTVSVVVHLLPNHILKAKKEQFCLTWLQAAILVVTSWSYVNMHCIP